jgi:hypothetical protein
MFYIRRFGLERSNCGRLREFEYGFNPATPMAPNSIVWYKTFPRSDSRPR